MHSFIILLGRLQSAIVTDLSPYIHRTAWLMFCRTALNLVTLSHKSSTEIDADYIQQASVLLSHCVTLVCDYLTESMFITSISYYAC